MNFVKQYSEIFLGTAITVSGIVLLRYGLKCMRPKKITESRLIDVTTSIHDQDVQNTLDACKASHSLREKIAYSSSFTGQFLPIIHNKYAFIAACGGLIHAEI